MIGTYRLKLLLIATFSLKVLDDVAESHHAKDTYAIVSLYFLYGRKVLFTSLLAIDGNNYRTCRRYLALFKEGHNFTDGSSGCYHIIDNDHLPLQRCADECSAFTVTLCLLAVEYVGYINLMFKKEFIKGK